MYKKMKWDVGMVPCQKPLEQLRQGQLLVTQYIIHHPIPASFLNSLFLKEIRDRDVVMYYCVTRPGLIQAWFDSGLV